MSLTLEKKTDVYRTAKYDFYFCDGAKIETVVTRNYFEIEDWMKSSKESIFGLCGRWFSETKHLDILQLCDGNRCLIIQLPFTVYFSQYVIDFFKSNTFYGIPTDKLAQDYKLKVTNWIDVRIPAATHFRDNAVLTDDTQYLCQVALKHTVFPPLEDRLGQFLDGLEDYQVIRCAFDAVVSYKVAKGLGLSGDNV